MPQPAELAPYQAAGEILVADAVAQLGTHLGELDWNAAGIRSVVTALYGTLVTSYRQSSSALGLQMYADLRGRAEVKGTFRKVMAPDPDMDWLTAKVDAAFKVPAPHASARVLDSPGDVPSELTGVIDHPSSAPHVHVHVTEGAAGDAERTRVIDRSGSTSAAGDAERTRVVVTSRLAGSMQRMVTSGSRETVALCAGHDGAHMTRIPDKPGVGADPTSYMRIPTSLKPCAFCVMCASREWRPYKSAASAGLVVGTRGGRARGTQAIGEKYHDLCGCIAVPYFGGRDPLFDRSPYVSMWAEAYEKSPTGRTADVLASMRQIYGLA